MTRTLLLLPLAVALAACVDAEPQQMDAFELTIPELQAAMTSGETTSAALVQQYLDRIDAFDGNGPHLKAMITINPRALEEAAALDREREDKGPRGPLHGIPVVLKDNYDTHDMPTTGGSASLEGSMAADDAYQVRKIREAGAIVLAKSNLAEFAFTALETVGSMLPGWTRPLTRKGSPARKVEARPWYSLTVR